MPVAEFGQFLVALDRIRKGGRGDGTHQAKPEIGVASVEIDFCDPDLLPLIWKHLGEPTIEGVTD